MHTLSEKENQNIIRPQALEVLYNINIIRLRVVYMAIRYRNLIFKAISRVLKAKLQVPVVRHYDK